MEPDQADQTHDPDPAQQGKHHRQPGQLVWIKHISFNPELYPRCPDGLRISPSMIAAWLKSLESASGADDPESSLTHMVRAAVEEDAMLLGQLSARWRLTLDYNHNRFISH